MKNRRSEYRAACYIQQKYKKKSHCTKAKERRDELCTHDSDG